MRTISRYSYDVIVVDVCGDMKAGKLRGIRPGYEETKGKVPQPCQLSTAFRGCKTHPTHIIKK